MIQHHSKKNLLRLPFLLATICGFAITFGTQTEEATVCVDSTNNLFEKSKAASLAPLSPVFGALSKSPHAKDSNTTTERRLKSKKVNVSDLVSRFISYDLKPQIRFQPIFQKADRKRMFVVR